MNEGQQLIPDAERTIHVPPPGQLGQPPAPPPAAPATAAPAAPATASATAAATAATAAAAAAIGRQFLHQYDVGTGSSPTLSILPIYVWVVLNLIVSTQLHWFVTNYN